MDSDDIFADENDAAQQSELANDLFSDEDNTNLFGDDDADDAELIKNQSHYAIDRTADDPSSIPGAGGDDVFDDTVGDTKDEAFLNDGNFVQGGGFTLKNARFPKQGGSSSSSSIFGDDDARSVVSVSKPGFNFENYKHSTYKGKVNMRKNSSAISIENPAFAHMMFAKEEPIRCGADDGKGVQSSSANEEMGRLDDNKEAFPETENAVASVPKNAFEQTLDELQDLRRRRNRVRCTETELHSRAERLVADMRKASEFDRAAVEKQQPALMKVCLLKRVVTAVRTENMDAAFVYCGGIEMIADWLTPFLDVGGLGKPCRQIVHSLLLLLKGLPLTKDVVKASRIGVVVASIFKDPTESDQIRLVAESLIQKWLSQIVNPDQHGDSEIPEEDPMVNMNIEQRQLKRAKFWEPTNEQILKEQEEAEQLRHPRIVGGVKPSFAVKDMPISHVKKSSHQKVANDSSLGRVSKQLTFLSSTNKKQWKGTVPHVRVQARK